MASAAARQHLRYLWSETGLISNQGETAVRDFLPDWDFTPAVEIVDLPREATLVAGGKRLYLWVEFLPHPAVTTDAKLLGVTTTLTGAPHSLGVIYLHWEQDQFGWRRWDNSQWVNLDNGLVAAPLSNGIVRRDADNKIPGQTIYDLGAGWRYLLGSTVVANAPDAMATLTANVGLPGVVIDPPGAPPFPATVVPATLTIYNAGVCCVNNGSCMMLSRPVCEANGFFVGWNGSCTTCEELFACRGDMNCDGVIDFDDIDPFVAALSTPWSLWHEPCPWIRADADHDNDVDFDDIDPFVAAIGMSCP